MYVTGPVNQVFAYAQANWAWAQISGNWYRIESSAGADSITNILVVLSVARVTGASVTAYIDSAGLIQYAYSN